MEEAAVYAIRAGDVDGLRGLLAANRELARTTIVDEKGVRRTLLHIACDWPGHLPNIAATIAALIEAGADQNAAVVIPDRDDMAETPLHWAASNDDVEAIDALLDGGADIEVPGAIFTGGSPMSDAVIFAQWNAARRLLARGARTTFWQSAALGITNRVRDHLDAEPASERDITNAFWNACRGGHRETAAFLLERGAELNWIGHDDKTPLDMAEESGAQDCIAWLRGLGAKSASML